MYKLIFSNICSMGILVTLVIANHEGILNGDLFRFSSVFILFPMIYFYNKPISKNKNIHIVFATIVMLGAMLIVNLDGKSVWPLLVFLPIALLGILRVKSSLDISVKWKLW